MRLVLKKIIRNFALDLGLLLVLSALVAILSLIGMRTINERFVNTIEIDVRAEQLVLELQVELLEARRREKDFMLRWQDLGFEQAKEAYVVGNEMHMNELSSKLLELEQLLRNSDMNQTELNLIVSDLIEMGRLVQLYQISFHRVVDLIEKRGFVDTGLEGELREAVHDVEEQFGTKGNALYRAEILLLNLRRNEKDYMLRGEEKYIDALHKGVDELEIELQTARETEIITPSTQLDLLELLRRYENRFTQLVETENEISVAQNQFRDAAHALEPLMKQIDERIEQTINDKIHNTQLLTGRTTDTVTVSVVVILFFGFCLTYILVNQVKKEEEEKAE